jgi:hypothetical protein
MNILVWILVTVAVVLLVLLLVGVIHAGVVTAPHVGMMSWS